MKKTIAIILFFVLVASSVVKAQVASIVNPLNLENVTTVPGKVYVGSSFTLMGTVRNVANTGLSYVWLTVQGGFPFSKTSPISSFYVGSLGVGQTYQLSVPLTIDSDATNQQYSLQIKASYDVFDPAVTKAADVINSQTMTATIKVDKGVDIEIVNATFPKQIVPDMKNGEVIVYVQNMGINSAGQVQFNLAAQYPFTPSGKSFYIDKINPGETKAAVFHIDVDSSAAIQTFPLDMTVDWKEGNSHYSDTKTFGVPVVEASTVSLPLLSGLLSVNNVIILLLVVVVGFVFLRRRKKSK